MNNQNSIVYILTNDAMPGLVKIGRTDSTIEQRMRELYKTGVPVPFECFHASVVKNAQNVEGRIHRAFDKFRLNKNREFFEIEPESILEILQMVEIEDITPREDYIETQEDAVAMEKLDKRSKRFNFKLYDIPVGSTLIFDRDETKTCEVIEGNNVLYKNKEESLSSSALIALKEIGFDWKQAQGPAHWTYQGETLKDRKERMENE
jgi:hypothetical protein